MEGLFGFVMAAFALTGSPGPATLSLAATGAAFGARRGFAFLAGIVMGMVGVMAIIASGVTGVRLTIPGAMPVVTGAAGAYMAYLAYRIATAPSLAENSGSHREPSVLGGVFLALVNPKAYAAMAALFSGFVLVGEHLHLDVALKIAVLVTIITSVNVGWLFIGAALTRYFREPRANRAINVTFAVLLVASLGFVLIV